MIPHESHGSPVLSPQESNALRWGFYIFLFKLYFLILNCCMCAWGEGGTHMPVGALGGLYPEVISKS